MVNSRKLLLLLVAIAVVAASGFAQTVNCTGFAASSPVLRSGGLTERTGDVNLICTPTPLGAAGTTYKVGLTIFVSGGPISNRTGTIFTEVDLFNAPQAPQTSYVGLVSGNPGTSNAITFNNVAVPADTTSVVRIANIRVVAPVVTSTAAITQITDTVTFQNVVTAGNPPFILNNGGSSTFQVASVAPTLTFQVLGCTDGKPLTALNFKQCVSEPSTAGLSFAVSFQENIAQNAFKTLAEEGGESTSGSLPAGQPAVSDPADTGTRLVVNFKNMPLGVQLLVTDRELTAGTHNVSTVGASAGWVVNAAADGTSDNGESDATVGTAGASCDDRLAGKLVKAYKGAASSTGQDWYAVWEVDADNPAGLDTLNFGVEISYTAGAGLPAPTTNAGAITGAFGPFPADGLDSDLIPSFVVPTDQVGVTLSINACQTTLLFPYVTADLDTKWDTGLAFTNASADDGVANRSSDGACTLNFFGDNAPTSAATFPATGTIAQGKTQATLLSAVAPGFTGYIVAHCDFQFGHGLALLIEPGTGSLSFGSSTAYLALVIPDRGKTNKGVWIRNATPFSDTASGAGTNEGEQLAF